MSKYTEPGTEMDKQLNNITNSRPTSQSSSLQDVPSDPCNGASVISTPGTERQGSTKRKKKRKKKKRSSPVQIESGQGNDTYAEAGKESAEVVSVAHNPEKIVNDSVNSGILEDICRLLERVLNDQQRAKEFIEIIRGGEDVQLWLDTLQVLAKRPEIPTWLRSSIFHALLRLSKLSDLFPQCLMITNVEKLGDHPFGYGGFGDLWKGKIGGQILALKVPRLSQTSEVQKLLKDFMREGILWQQLEHPNVLPFMGIYYMNEKRTQLCLVSPWMERGNLINYLETTPREVVDHYLLVDDVASGLTYLHYKKIVHADLKGANVLVASDGRARIADFGLSRVVDSRAIRISSTKTSASTGTTKWCSPELFNPPYTTTTFSDIYAFAGVCLEIFTGKMPFHALSDAAVIMAVVVNKEHPPRPEGTLLNDGMWKIMEDCWNYDPQLRPTASDIVTRVAGLKSFKAEYRPARDWDFSSLCQIWKDVKQPVLDAEALIRLQTTLRSSTESPVATHNHTTSNGIAMVEEDTVDSDIVEDLCHLLEDVLNDERRVKELLKSVKESESVDIQLWINTLLLLVKLPGTPIRLRSPILKTMLRLSQQSRLFPQGLIIENVEKHGFPIAGGNKSRDIWKGEIEEQTVSLESAKAHRYFDVEKLPEDFVREAIDWQQLEHPNVLPLIGIGYIKHDGLFWVAPWIGNRCLTEYLKTTSWEDVDHYLLVHDIASGLAYLHEEKVVHCSLKGVDVLITPEGRACLGGFGLSRATDNPAPGVASPKRSPAWCSPELLHFRYDRLGRPLPCLPTSSSDMYAFACVCYEIFTGRAPFYEHNNDREIYNMVVHQDKRPARPQRRTLPDDRMWKIMRDCWSKDPRRRPAASIVVNLVADLKSFKTEFRPARSWDIAEIRKEMEWPVLGREAVLCLERDLKSFVRS